MERNEGMNVGGAGQAGMGGTTGGSMSGAGGVGGSSVGSTAGSQGYTESARDSAGGAADMAGDKLRDAKAAASDKLGMFKEKASNFSATLADRLEAGAEKLRHRGQTGQLAGADGQTVAASDQMSALTNRLAGGMQGTADMLRSGDLKGTIETQVRENPARTLLIAVGVGYLLGKALKK